MTIDEKAKVADMRNQGYSYREIAVALEMTVSKVKTYCTRNNLGGSRASAGRKPTASGCEQCGKPIQQIPGRKHKRFCCDACRMAWWACHRDQIKHKTTHTFTCAECGRSFTAYGTVSRKFCSSSCYMQSRSRKQVLL